MTSKPGLSANHWATLPPLLQGMGLCAQPHSQTGVIAYLPWVGDLLNNPRLVWDRQTQTYIWFLFPPEWGEVLGEILIHGWFSPLLAELERIKMSGFK